MTTPQETTQFDFWLGDWEVFTPAGKRVGTNQITSLFGGRALAESWEGAGDVHGRSLNAWDAARGVWHQTWVDSTGSLLLLDGGMCDGSMVMEGTAPSDDDPHVVQRHRISWTPSADGNEVRQLWEVSSDQGSNWEVAFDGRYRRKV
ncbi:MAG: hypothetical protein ABJA81_09010 [Nocardioidaceae bacterium]